eukprot:9422731-Pyramimonas_sp.AAC.1
MAPHVVHSTHRSRRPRPEFGFVADFPGVRARLEFPVRPVGELPNLQDASNRSPITTYTHEQHVS